MEERILSLREKFSHIVRATLHIAVAFCACTDSAVAHVSRLHGKRFAAFILLVEQGNNDDDGSGRDEKEDDDFAGYEQVEIGGSNTHAIKAATSNTMRYGEHKHSQRFDSLFSISRRLPLLLLLMLAASLSR